MNEDIDEQKKGPPIGKIGRPLRDIDEMDKHTLPQTPDVTPMPDVIALALRLANAVYAEIYGFKPYPEQVAK